MPAASQTRIFSSRARYKYADTSSYNETFRIEFCSTGFASNHFIIIHSSRSNFASPSLLHSSSQARICFESDFWEGRREGRKDIQFEIIKNFGCNIERELLNSRLIAFNCPLFRDDRKVSMLFYGACIYKFRYCFVTRLYAPNVRA